MRDGTRGAKRRQDPARRAAGKHSQAVLLLALVGLLAACRTAAPPGPGPDGIQLEGMASWYGPEFAGRPTANGEIFDPNTMTAAHRSLPFGTIIDVTNLKNNQSTRVRINDRGPFVGNRIIDLSYAAAKSIDMVEDGISRVRLAIIQLGRGDREPPKPYKVTIDLRPSVSVPDVGSEPSPQPVTLEEPPVESEEIPLTPEPIETSPRYTAPPAARPVPAAPSPAPAVRPREPGWKVQVGAFGVEENARKLARELGALINSVYVENVSGLFRVRIGPLDSRAEAIDVSERIHSAGYEAMVLSPEAK